MGQALQKFAPGNEEKKIKDVITPIIEKQYKGDIKNLPDFYHLISKIVEEINEKLVNMQFKVPDIKTITEAYKRHHEQPAQPVSKEQFREILEEIWSEARFIGLGGAKDTLLYVFGVPLTALFLKQHLIPRSLPNEVFIPAVTSLTVFVLAHLNKV